MLQISNEFVCNIVHKNDESKFNFKKEHVNYLGFDYFLIHKRFLAHSFQVDKTNKTDKIKFQIFMYDKDFNNTGEINKYCILPYEKHLLEEQISFIKSNLLKYNAQYLRFFSEPTWEMDYEIKQIKNRNI